MPNWGAVLVLPLLLPKQPTRAAWGLALASRSLLLPSMFFNTSESGTFVLQEEVCACV